MTWEIEFLPAAKEDLDSLDGSVRFLVISAITKIAGNPLPKQEGGLGLPLGNHQNTKLAGYYKIVLKKAGLRVVYKLKRINELMVILVISARADGKVYDLAHIRALELAQLTKSETDNHSNRKD